MNTHKQDGLTPPVTVPAAARTKTEDEKRIHQFDELIALYVLKENTRDGSAPEGSALFAGEVARQMNALFPHPDPDRELFSERTLYRLLDAFASLEKSRDDTDGLLSRVFRLLPYLCGGEVRSCPASRRYGKTAGKQKKYYFAPLLSEGDMDMICGSVRSSRYLSDAEKEFLLARLQILCPAFGLDGGTFDRRKSRPLDGIRSLPQRPRAARSGGLPVESSKFLPHIQRIHEAIRQGWQIRVTYGVYGTDARGNVDFRAANPDAPYILNPYAMMWNGGRYYLIATHRGHDNPTHFRLDRILSVQVHTRDGEDGALLPAARDAVPALLRPYFKGSGRAKEFDATRYANTYPDMRIYGEENRITCRFAYTPTSLQILIDSFGAKNLQREDAPADCIRVRNVQYENALGFCVRMADQLTLLSPPELVEDVRRKLSAIAKKYEA